MMITTSQEEVIHHHHESKEDTSTAQANYANRAVVHSCLSTCTTVQYIKFLLLRQHKHNFPTRPKREKTIHTHTPVPFLKRSPTSGSATKQQERLHVEDATSRYYPCLRCQASNNYISSPKEQTNKQTRLNTPKKRVRLLSSYSSTQFFSLKETSQWESKHFDEDDQPGASRKTTAA